MRARNTRGTESMPVRYTPEKIEAALEELGIAPNEAGHITAKEVATIFTWRASKEEKIEHPYPVAAVRRHVRSGDLAIAKITGTHKRWYSPEAAFAVLLTPKRKGGRRPKLLNLTEGVTVNS